METLNANPALHPDTEGFAVRTITFSDVFLALRKGSSDFWRCPSHYIFLVIIYPVVGMIVGVWTAGGQAFHLMYPIAAGFALVGPIAALGLYEISRRHEAGLDDHPKYAFKVLRSPAIGSIFALGVMLALVFAAWIALAGAMFSYFLPGVESAPPMVVLDTILNTRSGQMVLFWGNALGFGFALLVLMTTAIAFPLLVDRGGGAIGAVTTSIKAFSANPLPLLAWGLIVTVLLFIGLAIGRPILGQSTWHLPRAIVE